MILYGKVTEDNAERSELRGNLIRLTEAIQVMNKRLSEYKRQEQKIQRNYSGAFSVNVPHLG